MIHFGTMSRCNSISTTGLMVWFQTLKRVEWQLSLTISTSNSFALALIINDDSRWMSCACAGVRLPIHPAHGWGGWFAFILWNKNQMTVNLSQRHETHSFNFARSFKTCFKIQVSFYKVNRVQNNQYERFQNFWQQSDHKGSTLFPSLNKRPFLFKH